MTTNSPNRNLRPRCHPTGTYTPMDTTYSRRSPIAKQLLQVAALSTLLAAAGCSNEDAEEAKPEAPTEAIAPNVVALDAKAARAAGITVAQAGPANVQQTITLYGTVQSNAEREGNIKARYAGTIRSIAKRVGDTVSKGAALVSIESSESLQTYTISAPISGVVIERTANIGETVDTEQVLMRLTDLSSVWIEFAVFARDLGRVRVGTPITVIANDGATSIQATINYMAPVGEAGNQSIVARTQVENKTGQWVPGQFVTGEAVVDQAHVPVAVDPASLQTLEGKTVVFVQTPKGFEARSIEIGRRAPNAVEIRSGLRAGERYVAAHSYLLKADLTKGEPEEE